MNKDFLQYTALALLLLSVIYALIITYLGAVTNYLDIAIITLLVAVIIQRVE